MHVIESQLHLPVMKHADVNILPISINKTIHILVGSSHSIKRFLVHLNHRIQSI